jgi:hypothetical protein
MFLATRSKICAVVKHSLLGMNWDRDRRLESDVGTSWSARVRKIGRARFIPGQRPLIQPVYQFAAEEQLALVSTRAIERECTQQSA